MIKNYKKFLAKSFSLLYNINMTKLKKANLGKKELRLLHYINKMFSKIIQRRFNSLKKFKLRWSINHVMMIAIITILLLVPKLVEAENLDGTIENLTWTIYPKEIPIEYRDDLFFLFGVNRFAAFNIDINGGKELKNQIIYLRPSYTYMKEGKQSSSGRGQTLVKLDENGQAKLTHYIVILDGAGLTNDFILRRTTKFRNKDNSKKTPFIAANASSIDLPIRVGLSEFFVLDKGKTLNFKDDIKLGVIVASQRSNTAPMNLSDFDNNESYKHLFNFKLRITSQEVQAYM